MAHVFVVFTVIVCAFGQSSLAPYPFENTITRMLDVLSKKPDPIPSGLTKESYLEVMKGIVTFFRKYQASNGTIIDPYAKQEIQYTTPTYAFSSALLAYIENDKDLLSSSLLAFQSALTELVDGTCAQGHSNFYTLPLMLTYELYKNHSLVEPSKIAQWDAMWVKVTPNGTHYHTTGNWGIVAAAGEFLRYIHGFTDLSWVEYQLSFQLALFSSTGQYPDPNTPMAYDIFPRHYLDIMLLRGYNGKYKSDLEELMSRGAWTSLLIQSPNGEWPAGGRSGQHQWNEAVQTVIYELYADRLKSAGNLVAARAFKRAARLALQSVNRWIQSSKDLFIVKNRFDPSERFGYEEYSFLSNYNNLPSSMLGYAFLFADDSILEGPSFAETGGFAVQLDVHHKIIANSGGMYIEIETGADPEYQNTGLIRVHKSGVISDVGPSDVPPGNKEKMALGVSWKKGSMEEPLAMFWRGLVNTTLTILKEDPQQVQINVNYNLLSSKIVSKVTEQYSVTPSVVNVTAAVTPISGAVDSLKVVFPAFTFDGQTTSKIAIDPSAGKGTVAFNNSTQVFSISSMFSNFMYNSTRVAFRNGYLTSFSANTDANTISYSFKPS